MAASVKYADIERGTWLLRGAQDRRQSRAVRQFHIQGLTQDETALNEANAFILNKLASDDDSLHPDDTTLPVLAARSKNWAPGETETEVFYGHTAHSNPTQAPFSFARERFFSLRDVRTFRRTYDDGMGGFTTEDITTEGVYGFKVGGDFEATLVSDKDRVSPVTQIDVPLGRLTAAALKDVADLYGYHNTDAVLINGICRDALTLKFVGLQRDPIDANGTVLHYAVASYQWCPAGWGRWKVTSGFYFNTADGYGPRWRVTLDEPDDQAAFADAFPIHDGTTGPDACGSSSSVGGV